MDRTKITSAAEVIGDRSCGPVRGGEQPHPSGPGVPRREVDQTHYLVESGCSAHHIMTSEGAPRQTVARPRGGPGHLSPLEGDIRITASYPSG